MNKKYGCFVVFFVLLIALSAPVLAGAGISTPPMSERHFLLEQGFSRTWEYPIHGAPILTTNIEGDLVEYATLEDSNQGGPARTVFVTINVEDATLIPGDHFLFLRVTEASPEGAMLGGVASIRTTMKGSVHADYPYLKAHMSVSSQSNGTDGEAKFELKSYSTVQINTIAAQIRMTTGDGEDVIAPFNRNLLATLPSLETESVKVSIPTKDLKPGMYRIEANITYEDGEPIFLSSSFKIGSLSFGLDAPKVIYRGKINKVLFKVINNWNQKLEDVQTLVEIDDLDIEERSPTLSIGNFNYRDFPFYLEPAADAELRDYDGRLTVKFKADGQKKEYYLPFTIRVEEPPEVDESGQIVEERPGAFSFTLSPLTGAYLLVLLLVIVNLFLLLRQKKKE